MHLQPKRPQMVKAPLSLNRDQWELMTMRCHCAEPGCLWVARVLDADDAVIVLGEHLNLAHGWPATAN